MGDLPRESKIVRFGSFELDQNRAELRKGGLYIKLHQQPYRVLLLLLERPGEVVTRDELRKALWTDDTFVDFEHSLNSAVNKLRETLSDSASTPRFIKTEPRRGYRFVAPVEVVEIPRASGNAPAERSAPSSSTYSRPRRSWWRWAVLTGTAALAGMLVTFRAPSVSSKLSPLTTYPGHEFLPSLSPDGKQVAFIWDGEREDNFDVYTKVIGTERPLRLTSDPSMETNAVWSPDATSIAFLRVRLPETLEVLQMSPLGGEERKLGELRHPNLVDAHTRPGAADTFKRRWMSWLPNSEWLVVQDTPGENATALFLLSARTGEKRRLTTPPAGEHDRSPAASPDGRAVAFVRSGATTSQVYVLRLDASFAPQSQPVRVTIGISNCDNPAWTATGEEVVFSAGTLHNPGLWIVRASGSDTARSVHQSGDRALQASIAGSRLVYSHNAPDVNIWRVDARLPADYQQRPHRVIGSTYVDHMPQLSPDGKRVAFISSRTGSQEVWVAGADGSNQVRLTFLEKDIPNLRWSPDGNRIFFQLNQSKEAQIHSVSTGGGSTQRVIDASGLLHPALSPDGRWIYFTRQNRESGIWKAPLNSPNDQKSWIEVTRAHGQCPAESPDGSFLYYVRQNALWRLPLSGGPEKQVLPSLIYPANYAVVHDGVYFIPQAEDGNAHSLKFLDFRTNAVRTISSLDKSVMWGLTASSDGRSVVYSQIDHWRTDLMMLDNFR